MLRRIQAPEWVDRAQPENWFLWQAFHILRADRNMNGDIPHSAIMAYCDECGITCPVERGRMVRVMFALNNVE